MKHNIRKEARDIRRRVIDPEVKSTEIMNILFGQLEYQAAKVILLYISKGSEVMTHGIVAHARLSKKIVLPVTVGNRLVLAALDDNLVPGAFGIMEPQNRIIVEPAEIDMAIIPGIAFDKLGARIGYGKGYYDQLLANMKCPKFALAYSEQLVEHIPCESHDVNVDRIITEDGVIECAA